MAFSLNDFLSMITGGALGGGYPGGRHQSQGQGGVSGAVQRGAVEGGLEAARQFTQSDPEYYRGRATNEAQAQQMVNDYRERQYPGVKPLFPKQPREKRPYQPREKMPYHQGLQVQTPSQRDYPGRTNYGVPQDNMIDTPQGYITRQQYDRTQGRPPLQVVPAQGVQDSTETFAPFPQGIRALQPNQSFQPLQDNNYLSQLLRSLMR